MADLTSILAARPVAGGFMRDARFSPRLAAAYEELPAPVVMAGIAMPPPDPLAQAYAQGYGEGLAAAQAQAHDEGAAARADAQRLRASFSRLDSELAETLRQRLLTTVVGLCESALAPLTLDMPALVARVNRAVALFARADDQRVIRLHPDDLALAQPLLPADWTLAPDARLARGALRVETPGGGAEDGPDQWRAAILEALDLC